LRGFDEVSELGPHTVATVWETGDSQLNPTELQGERTRTIEYVYPFVMRQHVKRDMRPLVVTRYDKHRYPRIRHTLNRQKSLLHEFSWNATPVQQIATVHHTIHPFRDSDVQNVFEVGEKIVAPAAAFDSRACGQVEAKMGVGEGQDSD
jgi:hypothetical protein